MIVPRLLEHRAFLSATRIQLAPTTSPSLRYLQRPPAMSIHMQGRCVCNKLQYSLDLDSPEDARATLCHCHSCRRAFGTNYGLTAKVPIQAFRYESGTPKKYKQENGVTREFCDNCGAYVCEYGVSEAVSAALD
jgi:hypothetical protein